MRTRGTGVPYDIGNPQESCGIHKNAMNHPQVISILEIQPSTVMIYDVSWHVSFPFVRNALILHQLSLKQMGISRLFQIFQIFEDPTEERAAFVAPPEFQQIRILGAQHGHSA